MQIRLAMATFLVLASGTLVPAQQPALDLGTLTLDQLADRAATIVVSTVTRRQSEWEHSGGSRLIVTKVTLAV